MSLDGLRTTGNLGDNTGGRAESRIVFICSLYELVGVGAAVAYRPGGRDGESAGAARSQPGALVPELSEH